MVAGLKSMESVSDKLFDPTGIPSWTYLSTIADNINLALSDGLLSVLYFFISLKDQFKIIILLN
jgi:hypothetical protein